MPQQRKKPGKIYIGTSGWRYKEWGKKFYPPKLKEREILPYYASQFNTVELNASFYHLPKAAIFEGWRRQTPDGFVFAVKLSRMITHLLRLEGSRKYLKNFLMNAAALGPKLGPVLVQLPPNFKIDLKKLAKFFEDWKAAEAALKRKFPAALEVRNKSWYAPEHQKELLALLKKYKKALVFGHSSKYPYPETEPLTAPFIYLRFHGPTAFAGSLYGKKLERWAPKVRRWARDGIQVYAYFNNDQHAYATRDVTSLKRMVK